MCHSKVGVQQEWIAQGDQVVGAGVAVAPDSKLGYCVAAFACVDALPVVLSWVGSLGNMASRSWLALTAPSMPIACLACTPDSEVRTPGMFCP